MDSKKEKKAGRPQKFNEPTKRISLRVPASKYDYIKSIINRWIEKFK